MIDLGSLTGGFIAGFIVGSIASYSLLKTLTGDFEDVLDKMWGKLAIIRENIDELRECIKTLHRAVNDIMLVDKKIANIGDTLEDINDKVHGVADEVETVRDILTEKFRWQVNINVKTDTGDEE